MLQKRILLIILVLISISQIAIAQNIDLFSEKSSLSGRDITTGIFKSTRVVNGQSIENVGAGVLDFKILHRFGTINQGGYNLFGLDQATMRLGLDYGINSKLMVGLGRSTFEKQYDAFVKYRIIRQQTGDRNIPLSVSYAGTAIYKSLKDAPTTYEPYISDKFSFAHQILIASKFNDYFSLQFTPTVVHYNMVEHQGTPNDFYSLGTSFRVRVSPRVNITSEYYYRIDKLTGFYNPLTIGVDIETGGHVFQLHVTNSTGMTERTFINETTGSWGKGDLRFGFNISRVFTVRKPKELRGL
jgi:hypothetical protein